jgi:hypothetical protein
MLIRWCFRRRKNRIACAMEDARSAGKGTMSSVKTLRKHLLGQFSIEVF